MPARPRIMRAGREVRALARSGHSSSMEISGLSRWAMQASITSPRLCGGMLVAMPTAMPPEPLTSRLGNLAGSTDRLLERVVVVLAELDRVLVEVVEQRVRDLGQPALGVALGRRRIAVDRAEVALAVDQRQAHGEVLRHAHQRVVDREVAVRVVFAHHLADDAGALDVFLVPVEPQLVHAEQDAPVHRLQAVAHVGQRAARRSRSWRNRDRSASSRR